MPAERDPHSRQRCFPWTAAQSGAGTGTCTPPKGNTTAEAVVPNIGTMLSVLQEGRCRVKTKQGKKETLLHGIRPQQKAGYCSD